MEYRGLTLDPFQEQAIRHLEKEHSVLVSAPTGTGKTIIADWMVDAALREGKQVIYTAPIKALSNQKFRDYCRLHGEENVGLVTGDLVIRRNAPCLVMTTEILRNILLDGSGLDQLKGVVIDEAHFLDDRERGTVWEEVLIYLPQHVLVVALSATFPNLDDFAQWLADVRDRPVEVIVENQRAVPLDFHVVSKDTGLVTLQKFDAHAHRKAPGLRREKQRRPDRGRGRGRGRPDRREVRTSHIDIFKQLSRKDWLPYLYFVFSRRDAEQLAHRLGQRIGGTLLTWQEESQVIATLEAAGETIGRALSPNLKRLYGMGIAFHHAGLHVHLKALVEELYEKKLIKVLYCTSTFALGINMPARSVAFHGLEKFDGESVKPLTTRGFMQKAGRAGRRGLDEHGHVVLRMDAEDYLNLRDHIKRYRRQSYEPVRSRFSLSWNSVVNLLDRHERDNIRDIVEKSFLSWHLRQRAEAQREKADSLEADGGTRHGQKEAARLRRRANKADDRCWREFERKAAFLQEIGYIDADGEFNAGAKILRNIQIAEIMTTELVLDGVFESIDAASIFGILCAISGDLPRSAHSGHRLTKQERALVRRLEQTRWSPVVEASESLSIAQPNVCGELLPIGRAWANGQSLEAITNLIRTPTDIAGSLVGTFRRAKDLAKQLTKVYEHDPERLEALQRAVKSASRDEVEVVG